MGDLTAYYAYPQATTEEMKTIVVVGKGSSPRDVRQDAELKTEQTMDLSVLSTMLISEKTARNDIYEYLDGYFRDVNTPITTKLALAKGELKPFFELSKNKQSTTGEYYNRFIKSLEDNSIIIPYTFQTIGSLLFEQAQDLTLPYINLGDEKIPILEGIALFSGKKFTGETLNPEQGVLLNILNDSLGKSARLTYMQEDSPVSIRITKLKRDVAVSNEKIELSFKLKVVLLEYPKDNIKKKGQREELQKFLASKIESEMKEVVEKLQKAKCDAIGLGRIVRSQHTKEYEKKWNEKFSELDIPVNVEVEIEKSGILY